MVYLNSFQSSNPIVKLSPVTKTTQAIKSILMSFHSNPQITFLKFKIINDCLYIHLCERPHKCSVLYSHSNPLEVQ